MKTQLTLGSFALALLLAGCGDSSVPTEASTVATSATVPAANPPQAGWTRYQIAKYQAQIDYPNELVAEAGSETGNRFKSADGSVVMSFEALPDQGQSLPDFAKTRKAAQEATKASVKETHEGGSWYMLVSAKDDKIIYEHGFQRGGIFSILTVSYPASTTATWQPRISDILKTVIPGTAS
ncbi:hypothetical protein [Chitinilyticum aquatile]|uniref:hypothetical protein n=1 Tax=Chitinilyticum aquatile TaxID=362520 RepID=UPI0004089FE2|nr:hypothetical protein [Chitinilyticum aquatile]